MKHNFYVLVIAAIASLTACKKNDVVVPPMPVNDMEYIDLKDQEIKSNLADVVLDLDKNGRYDIIFGTLLVGDPINKVDKTLFLASTSYYVLLPVNANEATPVKQLNDAIPVNDFGNYQWANAVAPTLMQRTETVAGEFSWQGNWLNKFNQYLPIQLVKNNQRYNGWIELTADQANQRLMLHKAALCKQPEVNVLAGK